jgi:hypothetical protein
MSEPLDHLTSKPERTWLSSLLLVLGVLSVVAAAIGFCSSGSGFVAGLFGFAVAAVFLSLGRTLDYLNEIVQRLRRLEEQSKRGGDRT